jgi:hypothetical protein
MAPEFFDFFFIGIPEYSIKQATHQYSSPFEKHKDLKPYFVIISYILPQIAAREQLLCIHSNP